MKQRADSTAAFPAAVYEFGRTSNLGDPLAEHRWRLGALEFYLMPLAGFWIIFFIWVIWELFTSPRTSLILEGLPGLMVIAAMAAASFWYFIACFRRRSSWSVYVFTNGFAYFKGRKIDVFRWEETKVVEQRITPLTGHLGSPLLMLLHGGRPFAYALRVERADGRRVWLNEHLRNAQTLGEMITQLINAAWLAKARRGYHAGEVVDFGPVRLSKDGVSKQNRILPWSQIKEIVLERGYVHIRSKEGGTSSWSPIPGFHFSDVTTFMTLVREVFNPSA